MKLGANITLGAAAQAVELQLCEAARRGDAQEMDRLLDLLRALSDVEELDAPGDQALRAPSPRAASSHS